MNRMIMAGVVALALCAMFTMPGIADKKESDSSTTPVAETLPAPDALKISDGEAEGFKRPLDVYKKAVKAAKAGEKDALKKCFSPDDQESLDQDSWEKEGDEPQTNLEAVMSALKNYSDEGTELAQGSVGDYALVAVRNGESSNLVKLVRSGTYDEETGKIINRNWYLLSHSYAEYKCDFNAPGVKAIRDAIEKGDVTKLKEYLDEYQTQVLDLITGVEEGVDGYALLAKRLKKNTTSEAKPVFLLSRWGSSLCYWFHTDKADSFIVLNFQGNATDWDTGNKYTDVKVEIRLTSEFQKDAGKAFKDFVQDWGW